MAFGIGQYIIKGGTYIRILVHERHLARRDVRGIYSLRVLLVFAVDSCI